MTTLPLIQDCVLIAIGTIGFDVTGEAVLAGNLTDAVTAINVNPGAIAHVLADEGNTYSGTGTVEPIESDRAAWNALNYSTRHTNDIDSGIHWTQAELDSRYGTGVHDATYLRLDTTNRPLTGPLTWLNVISGSGINFDNIHDGSTINSADDGAMFASFDAQVEVSGTTNYNHIASLQDRTKYQGSGSLTNQWGYLSWPEHTGSGTLIGRYAVQVFDIGGAGPVTNNYGLYVSQLTRGANNYAIWVENNLSHFGGIVRVKSAAAGIALDHNSATGNFILSLSPANLTANHRATFQNADGTVAYLTDLPTAGHAIQDEGTPLTQRANLNFVGDGVTVTDDAGNSATVVTIPQAIGVVNVYNETQTADGVSTIYYLLNYAAPSTIRVYIDGIRQPASDDVAPTDTVIFSVAPDLGALLLFDYEMDVL